MDESHFNTELNEIQLLLAEKRTSFALLRTGIAVFSLPLSVITVLIATSRYYNLSDIVYLFVALMTICTVLVVLGLYLIIRSMRKIFWYDRKIGELRKKDKNLDNIIH